MRNEEALCRSQSSQDELLAVARALKKQFAVIGKIRAILPRQRPGRKADLFILKAAESMGNSEWQGKKEKWGLAFGGVEGLPRVRAPADGFSAADPVFAPGRAVHSLRHEATARTRRTNRPKC